MPKIQNEEMTQFSVRVPKRLKDELFALADLERRSAAQQITLLLEEALQVRKNREIRRDFEYSKAGGSDENHL